MRLRTYVAREDDGTVLPGVAYHPATQGEDYLARSLDHDTLCAHALMQAMDEAGDVVFYADDDYKRWVYDRADAIMADWGFDSGEAE